MMARPRRGRSRGPELRGTLGTLLRTTLAQAGAVREVLERGARQGRARLDEVRSERKRDHALAELGELVIELIDRGEAPELAEHPDVVDALEAIAELDAIDGDRDRGDRGDRDRGDRDRGARDRDDRGGARGRPVAGRDFVTPPRRASFDRDRGRRREPAGDDDGAVSSGSWKPPAATSPGARVWRPPRDTEVDEPTRPEPAASTRKRNPSAEPGAKFQVKEPARAPAKAGGIQFDDDEDLADYMHPDDVPGTDKK